MEEKYRSRMGHVAPASPCLILLRFLSSDMDMEHVLRLCERLKLDEDDCPVVPLSKEKFTRGKDQIEFCLAGKIMG
ncbi:hypothetical protein TorRG33x02_138730 [Trema orientale]|uniref:Uncharacterized protein n=1 Tax=Trema orientale TaxID=63057 RepID=A0A2P5EXG9_TREOI|nr:hypothetical protein TorRG33x02_138730 [Trema orientale]